MAAGCTCKSERQDGAGVQPSPRDKHATKFRAGSHVAAYELVRFLGNVYTGNSCSRKTDLFAVRCLRCGREAEVTARTLEGALRNNRTCCPACKSPGWKPVAVSRKPCAECYDLSHQRPMDRLCKCGKPYSAEILHIEDFITNVSSSLGNLIDENRRHIESGDPGTRQPSHRKRGV